MLADARIGKRVALGVLFRDLHPRILRYLRASAPDDAEDLASDTWLDVVSSLDAFRGDRRALRAYALTVARNLLLDLHPNLRPSIATMDPDEVLPFPLDERDGRAAPGEAVPPLIENDDHDVADIATDEALGRVAALPRDQADVILLTILGELSVDEVAGIVGTQPGTVRVIQHRALVGLFRHPAQEASWA